MLNGEGKKRATLIIRPPALFLLLLSAGLFNPLTVPSAAAVGFSTNFNTYGMQGGFYATWNGGCPYGDQACATGYLGNADPTPFYEKAEKINGEWYFHAIVGDPATGFAQESYTRLGGNANNAGPPSFNMADGWSPDGAGMDRAVVTPNSTKSAVNGDYGTLNSFMIGIGNVGNPLDSVHISGTGGNDPSRSVFHMVLVSPNGDMAMDVNKPFLDKKPIISQTVQDGGMTSTFVADMTMLSYSEMNKAAPVMNSLVLDDPSIPGNGAANFDMANAQQSDITAGRFTFTKPAGYGWNTAQGWDTPGSYFTLGVYTYYDAPTGFDVYNADWASYFEYDQNALACRRTGGEFVRQDEGKSFYQGDGPFDHATTGGGPTGIGSCPGH